MDKFEKHNQYYFVVRLSIILSCLSSLSTAQRIYDVTFASFGNQLYQGGTKDTLTIKLEGTNGRRTETYILPGTCLFDYKNAPCSFHPELADVGEIRYLYIMTRGADDFMLDKIIVNGNTIDKNFPNPIWKIFEYTQQKKYPEGCQIAAIDILFKSIEEAPQIPLCTLFQTSTQNPTINPTIKPTNIPTSDPTVNPTSDSTVNPTNNPVTTYTTINVTNNQINMPSLDPTRNPTVHPISNTTTFAADANVPIGIAWLIGTAWTIIIIFMIVIIIMWKRNAMRYAVGKPKRYQNVDPHGTDSEYEGQNTSSGTEETENNNMCLNMDQLSQIVDAHPNIIEKMLKRQATSAGTSTSTDETTTDGTKSLVNTETEFSHLGTESHARHFVEIHDGETVKHIS